MPKALQYQTDSIIYFRGNKAETILLLQSGRVCLISEDLETRSEVREVLGKGEFFGVKSALGRYPREENAIVLENSVVLSFTVAEFEVVATGNVGLIMQMLKVFSNQMRRIHKQVASLLKEEKTQAPDVGLFAVGEYYFKNKKYSYARHIFERYLSYYPSGKQMSQVEAYLRSANTHIARYGDGLAKIDPEEEAIDTASVSESAQLYTEAQDFISQGKYQPACQILKKVADLGDIDFVEKSEFEMRRCLFLMGKYEECIKYYTQLISTKPDHTFAGQSLFLIGQSHEQCGRTEQALAFYKKSLNLITNDAVKEEITAAIKKLGGT
ncbi:MAG: cyclic nucleotide-binding domain-containing protein [Treponema sp.]|jgi:CRP-like cAMP-binding protein|nr:cyclic nucleotide-binding domain-containing protein [Treponema sp.]